MESWGGGNHGKSQSERSPGKEMKGLIWEVREIGGGGFSDLI